MKALLCPSCSAPISPDALKNPHAVCDHCGIILSVANQTHPNPGGLRSPAATSEQLREWLRLAKDARAEHELEKAVVWYEKYLQERPDDLAVKFSAAGMFGEFGHLSAMCHLLQGLLDVVGKDDVSWKKKIAEAAFGFSQQSYRKLLPTYVRTHPKYPKSSAQRETTLKQINDTLEFAIRCASSAEMLNFVIRTYDEELDEIVYATEHSSFKITDYIVVDFEDLRPYRAEAIRTKREAAINLLRASGKQLERSPPRRARIKWNSLTGGEGCGCMILLAVLFLTATACVFAVETGLR